MEEDAAVASAARQIVQRLAWGEQEVGTKPPIWPGLPVYHQVSDVPGDMVRSRDC